MCTINHHKLNTNSIHSHINWN